MDNPVRIGSGGRLYADAREQERRDAAKAYADLDAVDDDGAAPGEMDDGANPSEPKPPPMVVRPLMEVIGPPPTDAGEPPKKRRWHLPRRDWVETRSTTLELAGITALTAGFWEVRPWAGLMAMGASLITLGVADGLTPRKRTKS